jgi:hypothetical protein
MYPGSPLDTPDDDDREVEAALDTAAEEAEREQAEADRLREKALDDFRDSGPGSLGDLDLRAAAQHAQVVGDRAAERDIDDVLAVREARR